MLLSSLTVLVYYQQKLVIRTKLLISNALLTTLAVHIYTRVFIRRKLRSGHSIILVKDSEFVSYFLNTRIVI